MKQPNQMTKEEARIASVVGESQDLVYFVSKLRETERQLADALEKIKKLEGYIESHERYRN